jgi:hypothetical protein
MSQEALARIEKAVEALAAEVAGLREGLEALRGSGPLTAREIVDFLDRYRAAEALGEAAFGGWIAACQDACLRGGLRAAQLREGSHARLLEARLKELGGSPRYEMPEELQSRFFGVLCATDQTDAQKLDCFFAQVNAAEVLRELGERADRMDRDPETQSLLRAIVEDERATLAFLQQAREQLGG